MTAGKPTGVDAALGRPSAVRAAGVDGARRQVRELLTDAVHMIPPCPRQSIVRAFVDTVASRLGA
jgi:geranylgeranyl diphosphate synthase type II